MEIKLNKEQHDYLFNNISINDKTLLKSEDVEKKNESFIINISEENADIIRDKCLDVQEKKGFDEDYKLTKEGKILEQLIDLFYN